ncbi:CMP-N-acetylneuraminate-poly-alpha-2,8-sialyltransferase-like isoform X2 [Anneissia japonica]|uniref:CMP-N-acetylneuraminate-poly-alpha-2, 8-sialyltransferase-like isoform X2 n=1 Tax=Anneissia japonica TaxID=1529436 RepID=UPI00142573A5|nr:CMP-N-acetylneuraminate-poly-alpha-2,8-sialyltransferase-like isoform X2 [Anneissia japonica]
MATSHNQERNNLLDKWKGYFLLLCTLTLLLSSTWMVYWPLRMAKLGLPKPKKQRLFSNGSDVYEDMDTYLRFVLNKAINNEKVTNIRKASQQIKLLNRCAVVGSSGILTGSQCGKEISAHDFIMRLNMAETEGFENDVGDRTNLMSLNTPICVILNKCLRKSRDPCKQKYRHQIKQLKNSIVVLPRFPEMGEPYKKQVSAFINTVRRQNLLDLRVPAMKTTEVVKRLWSVSKLPTAGLRILAFAFTFCRKISVYGVYPFSVSPRGLPIKYHYFDNGFTKQIHHNMTEEFQIFKRLNENHSIRLVTENCLHTDLLT